ncbi:hypothetical protein D9756_011051 [Leucocoprinus leucothites]|uniref:Uncharacterized protein n=1 Tax=Leucocoprinus leucothites TaxID=201217 RepID=A0A8H5CQ42_9AGAR|nr:hypothetical protein D9756_011051 [Leucoagaricus leucothites]
MIAKLKSIQRRVKANIKSNALSTTTIAPVLRRDSKFVSFTSSIEKHAVFIASHSNPQAYALVKAWTCKYLLSFLGQAHEEARIQLTTSGTGEDLVPSGATSITRPKAKHALRSDMPKADAQAPDGGRGGQTGGARKRLKVARADEDEDVGGSEPPSATAAAGGNAE